MIARLKQSDIAGRFDLRVHDLEAELSEAKKQLACSENVR